MALSPTLDSLVRTNREDVLFQELQGEAVLLNLKTGAYFGLDPVSTRIWQLLQGGGPLSGIVETVVVEFDVTADRFAEHLLELIAEMEAQGLVAFVTS